VTDYGLPFASIKNQFLRLDYLTTTGPRIVGIYASGAEGNLLANTPEVHWETPHGEYYLRGGHRLWTAPEDPFYTCPEDGLDVVDEDDAVFLKSPIDASGQQKEIAIRLNKNSVYLSQSITWLGGEPQEFSPWGITQLRLGGTAILPLANGNGLAPDRNLVFWPYSQINDERLKIYDDLWLLHGVPGSNACKIGNFNRHGWIACTFDDALFVKRFVVDASGKYPDIGCNVEAYVKDVCLELEILGPSVLLNPGESITLEETWQVFTGDYPATLECARNIKNQLSR